MTRPSLTDVGLLSTVRSGTPVEAAVSDHAWLQAMLDAEAALARAQARLGLIPDASAAAVTEAAHADRYDLASLAHRAREAANPVVALVTELQQTVATTHPAAADHVHRGGTSQDILDSAAMLVAARALRLIHYDIDRAVHSLARLAATHKNTPMAARTLTQHAVPTTFGLKAAGWLAAIYQAAQRTRTAMHSLPAQLGGAAGTMAAYHEYALLDGASLEHGSPAIALADAFADELGLTTPLLPWHTARAPLAGLAADLSLLVGALGKLGTDVLNMARTEVAEAAEPAGDGRGASSAMPQKRNPVLATLLVSAALQMPSLTATLLHCLPSEDERPAGAWHAEWAPLREALRVAGGAAHTAAELCEGLTVDPDRMAHNLQLTGGQVIAERLVARLSSAMGKAAAKKHITVLTSAAAKGKGTFAQRLAADAETLPYLTDLSLDDLLDPAQYLGASGELVDRVLQHCTPATAAPEPAQN
ncbi:3-carboxy-cis,cis-muconate cycloisomerase [Streptomyces sp. NRRL F-4489]|uniref:3-carboxy-cis,cis-muconate cycloisomerase n=1 Tax=Streptomyces sp. NRRL F-4489 TaxID=1609095 RepID=UPI00074B2C5D|nr:3-carboxy-cis,cis-muconate cycloisomerase [Streptomyces sp. NRRL F-4489]KUL53510.1 3-carboxy-cis,cis-muconate cycloisomerase [Streptomyces sp. NRRL F-4489]